jgi:vacuolar-type H+-ATPase subunit H
MGAEEITSSVENIEIKAEKMLEEARSRANEIILKAKEEASRILSAEMPMDEVKREREHILSEARQKANQAVEASKKEASRIRTNAAKKIGKITERIVNIVTGAELK